MRLVQQNPFRVIGIISSSSLLEQKNKIINLKEAIESGRSVSDDYYFPVFGSLERNASVFADVEKKMDSVQERMAAGLFWFYDDKSVTDASAFMALNQGRVIDALDSWLPLASEGQVTAKNASALSNLSTLYLSGALDGRKPSVQSIKQGIYLKLRFLGSCFRYEFMGIYNGDYLDFDKVDLQLLFLWTLLRESVASGLLECEQFVSIVLEFSFAGKDKFIYEVIKDVAEMEGILAD